MPVRLLFLELNEINFDYIRRYCAQGKLDNLNALIERHGVCETLSEQRYEELEPWIQWVTAHTGLSLSEHGVFRLGDINRHNYPQIWEILEGQGLRVGAISPMNARNQTQKAAYFVPDPWTTTALTAKPVLQRLYNAVAQAVNDNAQAKITPGSILALLQGALAYARPKNYIKYAELARARQKSWSKAMFLDLLLADVFIKETRRTAPDFASLFLNAGAHIQHHYMFNSGVYDGDLKNPDWVVPPECDPVLEVYELYDEIVGQVREAFPDARLMLATGLHQDPHPTETFYWRLRHHAEYLQKIGISFARVEPRMSRDFLLVCHSAEEAVNAQRILESAKDRQGVPLFEVDNRGTDLFVMLTYPADIPADFTYLIGNREFEGLRDDVAFVAIKNGQHNGIGYFLDTGSQKGALPPQFPLKDIPQHICQALDVQWKPQAAA